MKCGHFQSNPTYSNCDAANLFDSRDDKQLRNVFKSETFKMNDRILPNTKVFHVPLIYLERVQPS